jgi:hypothetical protein
MPQALIAVADVSMLFLLSPILDALTPHPRRLGVSSQTQPVNPSNQEHCLVPELAKTLGHEEKWKLHNGCS